MATDQPPPRRGPAATPWPHERQRLAAMLWVSFLTAAVMTMLCFAAVDPDVALQGVLAQGESMRSLVYTITFFFFWAGTLTSAWLSLRLTRRTPGAPAAAGD